jgi:hypothetical protein
VVHRVFFQNQALAILDLHPILLSFILAFTISEMRPHRLLAAKVGILRAKPDVTSTVPLRMNPGDTDQRVQGRFRFPLETLTDPSAQAPTICLHLRSAQSPHASAATVPARLASMAAAIHRACQPQPLHVPGQAPDAAPPLLNSAQPSAGLARQAARARGPVWWKRALRPLASSLTPCRVLGCEHSGIMRPSRYAKLLRLPQLGTFTAECCDLPEGIPDLCGHVRIYEIYLADVELWHHFCPVNARVSWQHV